MDWASHPTKCICQCECGNITKVINTGLTSGKTQSCGCLQKEKAGIATTKDFTNTITPYGIKILQKAKRNNKNQWLWECECGICGKHFNELPARVLNGHVTSCGCALRSSGERLIKGILQRHHYDYQEQYSLIGCKYKNMLHFDFAVMINNIVLFLIEYDGQQHYKAIDFWGGDNDLHIIQKRDQVKSNYCKENNIPLLRLPYTLTAEQIEKEIVKFYKSVETAGHTW